VFRKLKLLTIPKDKIGALIGPGGKNIKALQENFEV
jgi:polyribonucleotide nucleotidyltransferase